MGFLKNAAASMGHVDKGLLKHGLAARGTITKCERTSLATGNAIKSIICKITVDVELEDRPVYTAHCKHPIQTPYLPQFESGQGVVAVRVDPEDPQNVALDLTNQPPPPRDGGADVSAVTGVPVDVGASTDITAAVQAALDAPPELRQGALSAAEVLTTGTPCRVIIQAAQPLGFQKKGLDVWGLTVNAIVDGEAPSQAGIGLGVPPEAMALVFPGANLPGARRSDVTDAVCIDWAAAVAAAAPH